MFYEAESGIDSNRSFGLSWPKNSIVFTILIVVFSWSLSVTSAQMGDESITLEASPAGTTDLDGDNDPNEIDQGDTAEWVLTYANNTDDPIALSLIHI